MTPTTQDPKSHLTPIQQRNSYNHDVADPEAPLVNIQVDGEWVKMPKGLNVVEVAHRLGKFLPHYCYHPKLEISGNCRMCLFEMGMPKAGPDRKPILKEDGLPEAINWSPRPAIGCATQIGEGMGIRLDSPLAQECRQGVMEFLLINHPLDCPICDQAGECKLQEYSVEYGHGESRFVEQKVHKPKRVDIGERIVLDDERCIMCSRCIRFGRDTAHDDALGFVDHGSHTTLTVHPDKKFNNDYSLNTVDICPVGALTSKDFRFKMRVWFLKETPSICTGCATGCNTLIGSRQDSVYRLTPRVNEEVNSHWMCDQGRLGFHPIHGSQRLKLPTARVQDQQMPAAWSDLFSQIQKKLQGYQSSSIAFLASATMTNEELFLLSQLRHILGEDRVLCDIVPRTWAGDDFLKSEDQNPNAVGAELLGISRQGQALESIQKSIEQGEVRILFAFHEDPASIGISNEALQKLDLFIYQGLFESSSVALADFILPGASFAEKRGSMINRHHRLQRLNKAIPLPGKAKDDLEILANLRALLQESQEILSFEKIFQAMAETHAPLAGLSFDQITDQGVALTLPHLHTPQP